MTNYVISSGVTTGYTLSALDTLTVLQGGVSSDSVLSSGATATVSSGGVAEQTSVGSGGSLVIEDGGEASGTAGSGIVIVFNGGLAISGSALSETISSGGVSSDMYIAGSEVVMSGGSSVKDGGNNLVVEGGGRSIDFNAETGEETVSGGAVASGTVISGYSYDSGYYHGYGDLYLAAGGSSIRASLTYGTAYVSSGAAATDTLISTGGVEVVSGESTSDIARGGELVVFGSANAATVSAGGSLIVSKSGIASAVTILSGGALDVYGSSVSAEAVVVSGGGLLSEGADLSNLSGAVISKGATLTINTLTISAGSAVALDVVGSSVAQETVLGGATLESGALLRATNVAVQSGATLSASGDASYVISVAAGGVASGPQLVVSGSSTDAGLIEGAQVLNTASYSDGYIYWSYASLTVESGGVASADIDGGNEMIDSGGLSISDTLLNGGLLQVSSGGTASAVTASGGDIYVNGGTLLGVTGSVSLYGAVGTISGLTVDKSAQFYFSSGAVSDIQVSSGGLFDVSSVTASGISVSSGGSAFLADSTAAGVEVLSGGSAYIGDVTATDVEVMSGGDITLSTYDISAGAFTLASGYDGAALAQSLAVDGLLLDAGAKLTVLAFQALSGATIELASALADPLSVEVAMGGLLVANAPVSASNLTILDSGLVSGLQVSGSTDLLVYSGGLASDLGLSGGQVSVLSGGLASHIVLDAVSAATSMVVSAGGTAKHTSVGGTYQYNGVYFGTPTIYDDGVTVDDVILVGGEEQISAAGVASAAIDSGGTIYALGGGEMRSATISSGGFASIGYLGIAFDTVVSSGATVLEDGYTEVYSYGLHAYSSATMIGTRVLSGATATAQNGTESSTRVLGVLSLYAAGGFADIVSGGGIEDVDVDANAVSTTVLAGGELVVSGGEASATLVSSGGSETVYGRGRVVSAVLDGGGALYMYSSGALSDTTIAASAVLSLSDDTYIFAKDVVASGGSALFASATVSRGQLLAWDAVQTQSQTFSGLAIDVGAVLDVASVTVLSGGVVSAGVGAVGSAILVSAGAVLTGPGEVGGSDASAVILGRAQDIQIGDVDGGYANVLVSAAGRLIGAHLVSGVVTVVGSGRTSATDLGVGGVELVSAGGVALHTHVAAGGQLQVRASGVTSLGVVAGEVAISALGDSIADTVIGGGSAVVGSGGFTSDMTVSSGGDEFVGLFGDASGTVVSSGGRLVDSGGSLGAADVLAGGIVSLATPPTASQTIDVFVSSAGSAYFTSAAIVGGAILDYGAAEAQAAVLEGVSVEAGGYIVDGAPTVGAGGVISLGAGAALSSTVVSAGGVLDGPGELSGVGAQSQTNARGLVSGVQLGDALGGVETLLLSSGGQAIDIDVVGGQVTAGFGGHTTSTTLGGGTSESVLSHGQAAATQVELGGELIVDAKGAITSSLIAGELYVSTLGSSVSDTVLSGGSAFVQSGAVVHEMTISSGGLVEIVTTLSNVTSAGGAVAATRRIGGITVSSGGVIAYSTPLIADGGRLVLHSGGFAENAQLMSGGVLDGSGDLLGSSVDSGGLMSGVKLDSGASVVEDAGKLVALRVGTAAGAAELYVGTVGSSLRVVNGVVSVGDGVTSARISGSYISGGLVIVNTDAVAQATAVSRGGTLVVSGGTASAGIVHGGGLMTGSGLASGYLQGAVLDYGSVADMEALDGGLLQVMAGASASLIQADSGAVVSLASGGAASEVVTVFGGLLVDDGVATYTVSNVLGGVLQGSGTLVQSGHGALKISGDGTAFSGEAVISGGLLALATSGALGAGSIGFEAAAGLSARLELDAASQPLSGATFANALTDFDSASDEVDLAKVAFVAGATASVVGDVLTLTDGAYSASFTLSGGIAANYAAESDGHGGTLIVADTVQPMAMKAASVAAPAALAQAAAGFDPGGGLLAAPGSIGASVTSAYGLIAPSPLARGG